MTDPPGFASAREPRLKAARRLGKRAFRERERRFLAEGPQAVREAIASGAEITDLFVTAAAQRRHADLIDAVAAGLTKPSAYRPSAYSGSAASASELRGRPAAEGPQAPPGRVNQTAGPVAGGGSGGLVFTPQIVTEAVMGELAQTVTPQGLLAVCGFVDVPLGAAVGAAAAGATRLVAVLANVRDPGNAGTVLRTADAAGADAVIFADASVDPYNGKCVRASAGSLFHLPVVTGVRLTEAVGTLRAAGLRIVAADGRTGCSLDDPGVRERLAGGAAWLFGNEAWGLPGELISLADEVVAVPIYGRAESLNLATAAAVCLYASARVQRDTGSTAYLRNVTGQGGI